MTRTLVLWDFENEPLIDNNLGRKRFDRIDTIIKELGGTPSIHAYADWDSYNSGKDFLDSLQYTTDCVDVSSEKYNAVDDRINHDLQHRFSLSDIDNILLITGDVDYRPAIELTQKYDTRLILFARGRNLSNYYIDTADRIFDHDTRYLTKYLNRTSLNIVEEFLSTTLSTSPKLFDIINRNYIIY